MAANCRRGRACCPCFEMLTCEGSQWQCLGYRLQRPLSGKETLASKAMNGYKNRLGDLLSRSSTFKKYFTTSKVKDENTGLGPRRPYTPMSSGFMTMMHKDPLAWCLMNLAENPCRSLVVFPEPIMLQYLDRHLSSKPRSESTRIEAEMDMTVSDIAATAKIIDILNLTRPMIGRAPSRLLHQERATWSHIRGSI